MKRQPLIFSLLLLALLLSMASPALAHTPQAPFAVNYCSGAAYDADRCLTFFEGGGAFLSEWGISLAVSIISIITMIVWFLDRAALALFEMVTGGTWLLDLKTDFIQGIASFLPDVLRDTAFGDGGLMYIALILAGLLMTIPTAAAGMNRLVKPQRVMLWGVLLSVLFVSGTVGYDLVDLVENMRQEMMQNAIGTDADYGVEKLVLVPMHAQQSEAEMQFNTLSDLPNDFVSSFFPDVQKVEISVKVVESGWFGVVESEIESPESKAARVAGAVMAIFYGLLGFFAGIIVFLSGVSFVLLGVAALFLILFLFAALPLGFFEFGETVLRMIVERYVQVVIYSLGIAIFVRLAAGMVDQLPNLNDVSTLLQWLLLMIVIYLSLRAILKSSFGLLSASFNTMGTSLGAVWSGAGPEAGPGLMARTKQVAGGAVTGALMMGGPQGALAGAAATMLGLPMMMRGMNNAAAASQPPSEPVRGDVFQNNGATALQSDPLPDQQYQERRDDIFAPPPEITPVQVQGAQTAAAAPAPNAASPVARAIDAARQNASADEPPFGSSGSARDAAQTARTIPPKS
jgi:hypothetical protein